MSKYERRRKKQNSNRFSKTRNRLRRRRENMYYSLENGEFVEKGMVEYDSY